MGVTIKDVAKRVGVTAATVSMVINNKPRISESTRRRVLEAIDELEYYPHAGARNLVLKRTNTIGVASSFFTSHFVMETLSGVESEIRNTDYNMVLYGTRGLLKTEETVIHQIARERKVDGLISVTLDLTEKQILDFQKNKIPLVALERDYPGVHCVYVNNEKAGFDAARHLLDLGHRRLALVNGAGPEFPARQREQGFRRALKEAGVAFDEALRFGVTDYSRKEGFEAASRFLEMPQPPSAVFVAAGDLCAMGVMQACREKGLKIPERLSVVGFDDQVFAELVDPALTTVRQPMAQMGAQALKMLLEAVRGEVKPARLGFDAELVVRSSTGPAPR